MKSFSEALTARDAWPTEHYNKEFRTPLGRVNQAKYKAAFAEHARNARLNELKNKVICETEKLLEWFHEDEEGVDDVREALTALRAELRKPASEGK